MRFSSLRVDGVYLVVTRLLNKYLIIVREIDKKEGRVLATRSTLDGKELRTRWYAEGTVSNWRTRTEAFHRQLADTAHTPSVLFPQSQTRRPVGPHLDDTVGDSLQAME